MTSQLSSIMNNVPAKDGRTFFLLGTRGFQYEIPQELQQKMIDVALIELTGKATWVVFCPEASERRTEDQERTVIYPLSLLDRESKTKVYAILDDYGSPEKVGLPICLTQYVLTFLLPEEY